MQNEITSRGWLLDNEGRLARRGFSRHPFLVYNPENIRRFPWHWANRLRLKEWDYFGATTPDHFFSVCISHIGYIGLVFAYRIDFSTGEVVAKEHVTPFGAGCSMPRSSEVGDNHFRSEKLRISFLRGIEDRRLIVSWPRFHKGRDLEADIRLHQPDKLDSIVMATPIGERGFFYNHKVNCMPTEGRLTLGDETIELKPDRALSSLDWGRGVWNYSTFWIWASASGFLPDGRTVGLNLGDGFGDLSAATENCFFVDGRITKLGWVDIRYDPKDTMKPWKFRADDGRLELTFSPFIHRKSRLNLIALKTNVNQMFGRYSGSLKDDAGNIHTLNDTIGWAEDHHARW